jgi:preprotein translocase subunit SecB
MKNSPLQLEDYVLSDLQFTILLDLSDVPPSERNFDPLNIEVGATTQTIGRNVRKWRCQLNVWSKMDEGGKYPYTFKLQYTGFFRVVDEFPEEFIEQMVRTNAPAVLYSAAREMLMFLTGRGRLGAVMLPSVTFLELSKKPKPGAKTSKKKIAKKK